MSVSVDTNRFRPAPFQMQDGIFRIVFAGRLDEFKDPPLMFETMARLHEKLHGRFEFHYIGMTDPARYAEFENIRAFTALHGFQNSDGVAAIVSRCHAGILTSYFEGMPCYLLETLSVGRPFAAIRLPQYDPLIVKGTSGLLLERAQTQAQSADLLSDAFVKIWQDIQTGMIDPQRVHAMIEPYSVTRQLARLFDHHRAIMNGKSGGQKAAAKQMAMAAQ